MTTLKDYARDLVNETIERLCSENKDQTEYDIQVLSEDQIDDLVDEFIDTVKTRIVGD